MNRFTRGVRAMRWWAGVLMIGIGAANAGVDPELQALRWREIGPFHGGRSDAIVGIPGDGRTFYFGGSDGGVWKTTDAGHHWRNVTDGFLTTGAIGALAVAPSNANIVYAGTGEAFPRGDVATGNGVWRSDDAGKTWRSIGLAETRMTAHIVIDPRDPEHVYVAALGDVFIENAHRGVYETRDGGAHWRRVLHVGPRAGAVDLVMDAHDPNVLYAAMWEVQRRPWSLTSGGPTSGLYRSRDGGAHWTNISRKPGLPPGVLGKIGVALSAANRDRVYALIQAHDGGLFRSDDGGERWTRVNADARLRARSWYFNRLYADPTNADRVIAPVAEALMISTDGGKTFELKRARGGDNHVAWIDPREPRVMMVGNDMGATITLDGGETWSPMDNQPTAAFYHVTVDDQVPFHLYGAQQEFATIAIASRNTTGYDIGEDQWRIIAQWESGTAVPVPGQPWVTYATGGFAGMIQRTDRRAGTKAFFAPWPEGTTGRGADDLDHRFQWCPPLLVSRFATDTLYAGSQHVWRSRNGGVDWETISADLSHDDPARQRRSGGPIAGDATSVEYFGTVFALAESPFVAEELWAGTDDGRVWITRDGGAKWREITPPGIRDATTISSIDLSRLHAGTAVIAGRRERLGDYAPYVYVTRDFGAHWRRIDSGLPRGDSSFVARWDTRDENLLFVGTLRGAWFSNDAGASWRSLQGNLPTVAIHDMAIAAQADALALATHGRGFWILDHLQPLRELRGRAKAATAFLYTPQAALLTGGSGGPGSIEFGAGENPPNGAPIFFHLARAPAAGELSLRIEDGEGRTLATFDNGKPDDTPATADAGGDPDAPSEEASAPAADLQTTPGMNTFVWNLREALLADDGHTRCEGPQVMPGRYRAILTWGDESWRREFDVVADPAITTDRAGLQARQETWRVFAGKACAMRAAQSRFNSLREKLTQQRDAPQASRATKTRAERQLARLDALHTALYDFESDAYLDSLAHPTALEGQLGTLMWRVGGSFVPPGNTTRALGDKAMAAIDARLVELDALAKQIEVSP